MGPRIVTIIRAKITIIYYATRLYRATLSISWTLISVLQNTYHFLLTINWRKVLKDWVMQKLRVFWISPWYFLDFYKKRMPLKNIISVIWPEDCSTKSPHQMIQRKWWSRNLSQNAAANSHQSLRVTYKNRRSYLLAVLSI